MEQFFFPKELVWKLKEIQVGEFLIKFTQILPKTHQPKIICVWSPLPKKWRQLVNLSICGFSKSREHQLTLSTKQNYINNMNRWTDRICKSGISMWWALT